MLTDLDCGEFIMPQDEDVLPLKCLTSKPGELKEEKELEELYGIYAPDLVDRYHQKLMEFSDKKMRSKIIVGDHETAEPN